MDLSEKLIMFVGIFALGISLVSLLYQGDITGRFATTIKANEIKPQYSDELPFVGCAHLELRCDETMLQECVGGRWRNIRECKIECEDAQCIDQVEPESIRKSDDRIFNRKLEKGIY